MKGAVLVQKSRLEETTVAKGYVRVRRGRPLHLPSSPILSRNAGCSVSVVLPLKVKVTFHGSPALLPAAGVGKQAT